MGNERLFLIAILLAIVGTGILFFSQDMQISITRENIGKYINFTANIVSKKVSNGHLFFQMDNPKVNVIIFKNFTNSLSIDPYLLEEGDRIKVSGKIYYYEGNQEIHVDEHGDITLGE